MQETIDMVEQLQVPSQAAEPTQLEAVTTEMIPALPQPLLEGQSGQPSFIWWLGGTTGLIALALLIGGPLTGGWWILSSQSDESLRQTAETQAELEASKVVHVYTSSSGPVKPTAQQTRRQLQYRYWVNGEAYENRTIALPESIARLYETRRIKVCYNPQQPLDSSLRLADRACTSHQGIEDTYPSSTTTGV